MSRLREIVLPEMNGGLNTHDPEYAITDNQSPDMLNVWFQSKTLSKRPGQALIVDNLDGEMYRISGEYNGYRAVHAGAKMYQWDGAGTATVVKTGVADQKGAFVEFGDDLFYIDGTEIWQIDSEYNVTAIDPYVPVVMINALPDLSGGDDNESYNLIGSGFCVKYCGDGSTKKYKLPQKELDDTTVKVSVDADDDYTEGPDFTVDDAAGTVTFSAAPASGTNNVWITAYKTVIENDVWVSKAKITKCTIAVPFGGESSGVVSGTRVFVMGNAEYPHTHWHSELGANQGYGMTYFPDTSEELLDQNSDDITAAAKMGSELIIFKRHSIFAVGYMFDGHDVYHPVRECHSSIGCDMPGSVQLVDNRLVFAHSVSGVHMLISTENALENIVKPLSANINNLLLKESRLKDACSCDHKRYYWLKAGDHVYLWDYESTPYYNYADYEQAQRRLAWYRWDGIDATEFCAGYGLFFGMGDGIVKLSDQKNDFGQAYTAYFYTKAFDLGAPDTQKTFMFAYPSFSSDGNVKVTVTASSDKSDNHVSREVAIRSFDWKELNWAAFAWDIVKFARTFTLRLGIRRASHIQLKVLSDEEDRGVGFTGARITYYLNRKNKR